MRVPSLCEYRWLRWKRLCWKLPPCRYTENFSQSSLKEYLEAGWNVVDISWVPLYIAGDHFTTQTVFELFNLFRVRAKKQRNLPFCLDFVHFPSCFVPSLSWQSAIVRHNRNVQNTRRLVCFLTRAGERPAALRPADQRAILDSRP